MTTSPHPPPQSFFPHALYALQVPALIGARSDEAYSLASLRAVFAVAFVLLLSLPFVPDARGESAEEMTQQALKLFGKEDYTKAAPLFRKAAEQGNAIAQFNLGLLSHSSAPRAQDKEQGKKALGKMIHKQPSGIARQQSKEMLPHNFL